nr:hypothetical protein [uncultured Campylobacter sp.]
MSDLKIYRGTIDNLRTNLETNVSGSVRNGKGGVSTSNTYSSTFRIDGNQFILKIQNDTLSQGDDMVVCANGNKVINYKNLTTNETGILSRLLWFAIRTVCNIAAFIPFFIALLCIKETRSGLGYTMIVIVVISSLLFAYFINKYVSMQQRAIKMLKQYLQENNL